MKEKNIRRSSCFNGGHSSDSYRLNARCFALETEIKQNFWIGFDIVVECDSCKIEINQDDRERLDWYWPVFIRQGNGWLQTQLCPNCAPRFSLRRALMRRGNRWPRWVHQLFTRFNNYYWLPCPVCGKMFGGHEKGGDVWDSPGRLRSTCGCNYDAGTKSTE